MRVGILGGTFDPVHYGHLIIAEEARLQLQLDRVLFLPAGQPWLKDSQTLSSSEHRVEMVRLAVASNPYFEVCVDEVERPGPTYTVDTLRDLDAKLGSDTNLYFILGADAMEQFDRWKEPERLLGLTKWAVGERPGHQSFDLEKFEDQYPTADGRVVLLSLPLMGVSGTEIRRRAKVGSSLRYRVPDDVADYIGRHKLYAAAAASPYIPACPGAQLLEVALERGALKYGKFTLSSGKQSAYYFDGRLISLDPVGSRLIAEALLPVLRDAGVDAVGGLTLGADPIVASIAFASGLGGKGMPGFIVRKEAKTHGTAQSIEGPLLSGSRVAIVDDVCTTGGSLFQAIEAAEAAGCAVVVVAAVLDRVEGGSDELRRRGYDFVSLLAANPQEQIEVTGLG